MRTKKVLAIVPPIIVSCLAVCEIGFRLLAAGTGHVRSTGGNAIWLRHAWVGEWHEEESYRDLAVLLAEMRIADGYFHAGPLTAAGTVEPERIAHASRLLAQMRRHAPDLRLHAWLGQVEARAGGPLDLASPEVRRALVGQRPRPSWIWDSTAFTTISSRSTAAIPPSWLCSGKPEP